MAVERPQEREQHEGQQQALGVAGTPVAQPALGDQHADRRHGPRDRRPVAQPQRHPPCEHGREQGRGAGDEEPAPGRRIAERRQQHADRHRQRLERRTLGRVELEARDLAPPHEPRERVVGGRRVEQQRKRRDEQARGGEVGESPGPLRKRDTHGRGSVRRAPAAAAPLAAHATLDAERALAGVRDRDGAYDGGALHP
jgi:hypothetical protein